MKTGLTILGLYLIVGGMMGILFAWESFKEGQSNRTIIVRTLWGCVFGPMMLVIACVMSLVDWSNS
jgi:hypothetical protein